MAERSRAATAASNLAGETLGNVELSSSHGAVRAYVAEPDGPGPFAGVIVLHEAYGLNDDIRAHADRVAAAGYLAIAPDLYTRGGPARCLVRTMVAATRGQGPAFADIDACRAWLCDHARSNGRVGVVGFCMGGGFALACAGQGRYDVVAPNYGPVPRHAERVLQEACPVVGSYGGDDWMLRGHARRLEAALVRAGVDHDVKEYPGASHSFMSRHTTGFATAMDRVLQTRYSPEAADDAWARILAFFERRLDSSGSRPDSATD
ncbi:MAG TPA: dienelactone hydrolase family protein [Acidimicrobiales bacterium]|nr:dienelactone hydrolase family protein [Acidimicrobiales bacterium]